MASEDSERPILPPVSPSSIYSNRLLEKRLEAIDREMFASSHSPHYGGERFELDTLLTQNRIRLEEGDDSFHEVPSAPNDIDK